MLGAAARDAHRIALLESISADQVGRHLAGDHHHGDGVHHRVGNRGDHVGRARAGGHQRDARLAGRARIALGRVAGTLLMAHQNVPDLVLRVERIIDRKDSATRIAEHRVDPLLSQRSNDDLGTRHLAGLRRFLRECLGIHGLCSSKMSCPFGRFLRPEMKKGLK